MKKPNDENLTEFNKMPGIDRAKASVFFFFFGVSRVLVKCVSDEQN